MHFRSVWIVLLLTGGAAAQGLSAIAFGSGSGIVALTLAALKLSVVAVIVGLLSIRDPQEMLDRYPPPTEEEDSSQSSIWSYPQPYPYYYPHYGRRLRRDVIKTIVCENQLPSLGTLFKWSSIEVDEAKKFCQRRLLVSSIFQSLIDLVSKMYRVRMKIASKKMDETPAERAINML